MGDDPDHLVFQSDRLEAVDGLVERVVIQGSKSLIDEDGIEFDRP